ncbi:protein TonB [Paracoccus aminovorans]|uniref:Protein TonB n=1 Tax=Paracoccus aminovorans TaxID=34004 RepID=A0A1I2ZK60_9RHOB|nr:energy transducer TonB [Paracoccus aminovorans]CQR85160.1 TonB family protein [Paracoccus aminovorans]SFH37869.1 protein TonB [Paracoccus aminovorans]
MSGRSSSALRDVALWGGAAAVVLIAHLGGALWVLHTAKAATPPGLPDPVFVDLAPIPEAATPPEEEETPEMAEAEPEPEPEVALPEPLPELEPVPDMNSLFEPPPDAVVLQKSERPKERPEPEPEPKKIVEKQPEPKKKEKKERAPEEQPARKATTQVRAQRSDRTAAPTADAGVASPRQVASWQSKVNAAVARHMKRTRIKGQGAIVVNLNFTVDPGGRVAGARLASSTGNAANDAALNRQVARMPRLPAHPSGKSITLTLPVRID